MPTSLSLRARDRVVAQAAGGAAGSAPGTPGLSDERPLGLSSSLVFIISVVIQVVGFLGNYFISHHIGIFHTGLAVIGVSGLLLTIASTINGMADLRVGNAYTYFIARGRDPRELTANYVAVRLGLVVAVSLSLFALYPLIFTHGAAACVNVGQVMPSTQIDGLTCGGRTMAVQVISVPQLAAVFGLFLITPLLWSSGTIYTQLWVARGDSIRSQYPLLLQSMVQTGGLIAIAFLGLSPIDDLWGFALAYVAGGVASTVYTLPTVVRFSRELNRRELRRMFAFAWPLMGGLVLNYLWTTAPTFFVAGLAASSDIAVFLAANGFRILLLGLPAAVSVPLFPHLTNLHVRKEYEQLRRRTWAALRYTSMLVIPSAIAIVVYRVPLINAVFVHNYIGGETALAILALSAIPAALSQIILTALTSVGRQRLDLYLTSVQVIVLLAVAFAILPPFAPFGNYGITGAAWAVAASSVASFLLNVYFMERLLAVRIAPAPIIWMSVSAVASFLVVAGLNDLVNPIGWWVFIPDILLGYVAYYVVLAGTGELTRQDVHSLVSFVGFPAWIARLLAHLCWREAPPDTQGVLSGHHAARSDLGLEETRLHVAGDQRRPDAPNDEEPRPPSP
jgi:O-antigen/teichoic acid export membrane protein